MIFRLLLKIPYIKRNIVQLMTACVAEVSFDNDWNIDKIQKKYDKFLTKRGLK